MKRILWISDFFPVPQQMTRGTWALKTCLALKEQGVDVVVLAPTPWIPTLLACTPNLKAWARIPQMIELSNLKIYYPKCPHYPRKEVRYSLYKYFPFFESELIYRWCKDTISYIFKNYPFQVMHTNFMFPCGYMGAKIKAKYGIPFVFHERGARRLDMAIKIKNLNNVYSRVVEASDYVITPSNKMTEKIVVNFHKTKNTGVVRDAGDTDVAERIKEPRPEKYKNKKIILSVGAFLERKGHKYLIRAVYKLKDKFPQIRCILIGSGEKEKEIKTLIHSLNLNDFVELYGQVSHDEVMKTMSWCDVFVLPSWKEAFGAVWGEAMIFGKPVIGCIGEGIGEVIEDGVHGFLVQKRDIDSLYLALRKLFSDNSLARSMEKVPKS